MLIRTSNDPRCKRFAYSKGNAHIADLRAGERSIREAQKRIERLNASRNYSDWNNTLLQQ